MRMRVVRVSFMLFCLLRCAFFPAPAVSGNWFPANQKDRCRGGSKASEPVTFFHARLFFARNSPAPDVKISVFDKNNRKKAVTVTDQEGFFQVAGLTPDRSYFFRVEGAKIKLSENARIHALNDKHEAVQKIKPSEQDKNTFCARVLERQQYNLMPPLTVSEQRLVTFTFLGRVLYRLPGDYPSGLRVYIVNDQEEILYATKTEDDGTFRFEQLPPDHRYIIRLEEDDPDLTILIRNEMGETVETIANSSNGVFHYERLGKETAVLALKDEEDVALTLGMNEWFTIRGLFPHREQLVLSDQMESELRRVADIIRSNPGTAVEIISHTDCREGEEYNLMLSEKRAKVLSDYFISKGISRACVIGKGAGESQPVNRCKDGVDCSEEEHAENQRTEFRFVRIPVLSSIGTN